MKQNNILILFFFILVNCGMGQNQPTKAIYHFKGLLIVQGLGILHQESLPRNFIGNILLNFSDQYDSLDIWSLATPCNFYNYINNSERLLFPVQYAYVQGQNVEFEDLKNDSIVCYLWKMIPEIDKTKGYHYFYVDLYVQKTDLKQIFYIRDCITNKPDSLPPYRKIEKGYYHVIVQNSEMNLSAVYLGTK